MLQCAFKVETCVLTFISKLYKWFFRESVKHKIYQLDEIIKLQNNKSIKSTMQYFKIDWILLSFYL